MEFRRVMRVIECYDTPLTALFSSIKSLMAAVIHLDPGFFMIISKRIFLLSLCHVNGELVRYKQIFMAVDI
jgi:hypothetical protein